MYFTFIDFDDKGNPTMVATDDGFCQTSRKFDRDKDGWMMHQLDYNDFPAIRAGQQMQILVNEVNRLRRENYILKQGGFR